MPGPLKLALALKALGGLAFLIAIIAAGAMNRSVGVVALLALAMTLVGLYGSKGQAGMAALQAQLQGGPAPEPKSFVSQLASGFVVRLIGLGVVFGLTVLISALFRETSLERTLDRTDILLVLVPTAIAFGGALMSQRMMARMGGDMMGMMAQFAQQMQAAQAGKQDPVDDDTIIEGEFTETDKPANDM